jgi:hypothetical protein
MNEHQVGLHTWLSSSRNGVIDLLDINTIGRTTWAFLKWISVGPTLSRCRGEFEHIKPEYFQLEFRRCEFVSPSD